MTYDSGRYLYEHVDKEGLRLLDREEGTADIMMLNGGSFALHMYGLVHGWEDAYRFVAIEGSGEWAVEIDPGKYPHAPCADGAALRGLWVKVKAPGA